MTSIDDPAMETVTRSFLLGTVRNPIPTGTAFQNLISAKESASELTALALVGQRMRFRRHGPPPEPTTATPIDDSRKIMPEAARPLVRRLVGAKGGSASDVAALAVADACHRLRLRPHPFDLPRLAAFARAHGEALGTYAAAWAERNEESERRPSNYFDADALDAHNWTSARPAARAEFIAAMRGREPDRARELVEAGFATDPAPVRARLLDALAKGLSQADIPFLESLAKDRAPTVRERAQQLLKYIPGTASADGRLRDLVARTKVSAAGLLRRRTRLALELPAHLQIVPPAAPAASAADAGRRLAAGDYAGVGLDAMAAAFGLPIADMIAAAADDAPLLALFARQASIERRFDVLAVIVREQAVDAWIDAIGTHDGAGRGGAAELPEDATVEQWCAAALAPDRWPALPFPAHLDRLYGFLRRPLPLAQARELLRSRAFATISNVTSSPGVIGPLCLALAALMPPPLRSELRPTFGALPTDEVSRAVLFLDCLALLDPPPS
jgi:hypothetical protein